MILPGTAKMVLGVVIILAVQYVTMILILFSISYMIIGAIVMIKEGLLQLANKIQKLLKFKLASESPQYAHMEAQLWLFGEAGHNTATASASASATAIACSFCANLYTTMRCARCKAARYWKCQIRHWRDGHKHECVETIKTTDDRVKRPAESYSCTPNDEADQPKNDRQTSMPGDNNSYDWPAFSGEEFSSFVRTSSSSSAVAEEGNTNHKPFIESSEEATKKDHEQNQERMRYLEEELAKYKNEIALLKSESNKWATQTSFVSRRLNSLMRECDEHQIAEEARITERRKQDERIHMLESERAAQRRELEEERKLVQRLKLEKDDEAQMAKRQVQEKSQQLADALKDVEYATARADTAENEWIKAKRELQEERELVQLLNLECEETRQSAMRQVEEKELQLANALKAAAAAEAKLSDLEKELKSSEDETCAICLTNEKDMAFGCGHMTCADCGVVMSMCPICREQITIRLRLFPG